LHESRRASLRRGRSKCPRYPLRWRASEARRLEVPDQIELAFRLGGGRQQRMKIGREGILPEWNGFDSLPISILQGEHHADADLLVGLHHRIQVTILVWIERQHVLDRRHP